MKIKKQSVIRWTIYTVGMLTLALGLTLSGKSGLGVTATTAPAFVATVLWDLDFGNANFAFFIFFVGVQFLLRGKNCRAYDLLQIPLALVFSQVMGWYSDVISYRSEAHSLGMNLLVLTAAILCVGIGAATTVNMRLVPNPVDGLVATISEKMNRDLGFAKNLFDFTCVAVAVVLSYAAAGKLVGVGIGTIIAMICVGRVVYLVNKFFKKSMCAASGLAA